MSAATVCFGVLLVFLFLNVPVFASIMAGSMAYFSLNPASPISNIISVQRVISGIQSIPLLAIPFFVAAGVFMNYSGVTRRVMNFCVVLTGRMTGGLAQVAVVLSTLMGGMSGSSLADAAMEAKMLVPEMRKKGYPNDFASVVAAMSSLITPLIPPGIAPIIYGSITGTSIGRLFVAGIVPGLLLCVFMMILVWYISKKNGYQPARTEKVTAGEFLVALKEASLPLFLPFIIIGGIRFGIFTPTEAGAIATVYALILGLYYRELNLNNICQAIKETVTTTAAIMLIVGTASCFAWILTLERIPQLLTQTVVPLVTDAGLFLLIVNICLLFVGMFVEATAAMIVLAPMLAPVAAAFGIDPVQFGMVVIFNMAIGSLSPPMGNLMFVTCSVTGCKISDFLRASVPFFALIAIMLLMITYLPFVSTFLPNAFFGK